MAFLLSCAVYAQESKYDASQELRGSGRVVRETKIVEPFDGIEINLFPAKITVEVGAAEPSVDISIDDNLRPLLHLDTKDGILQFSFKDPRDKPFWISQSAIKVTVKTPRLKQLKNRGSNSDILVSGLRGESFDLVNEANADITLRGNVNTFDLVSSANGTIHAEKLIAKTAHVVTQANATIRINAQTVHEVKSGHASLVNVANESAGRAESRKVSAANINALVKISFLNNSSLPRGFTLVSYTPGENLNETNGFRLAPYKSVTKRYPVGTAIYVASKEEVDVVMSGARLEGKPFITVNANDEGRTVKLVK